MKQPIEELLDFFFFGSLERAQALNVVEYDENDIVLSATGAKLIDYLIGKANERGYDTTRACELLIKAQADAALRQASRQLGLGA